MWMDVFHEFENDLMTNLPSIDIQNPQLLFEDLDISVPIGFVDANEISFEFW